MAAYERASEREQLRRAEYQSPEFNLIIVIDSHSFAGLVMPIDHLESRGL